MKKIFILTAGFLLMSANLYAGNGDLIVNGNLGVGTVSPGSKLEVSGGKVAIRSTTGDAVLTGYNAAGGDATLFLTGTSNTANWQFNTFSTAGALYIQNNGYVGIGVTDPQFTLDIYGSGRTRTGIWQTSDIKFKKDILPIDSALDKIVKLSGVSFEWIQDKKDKEDELIDSSKTDDNGSKKDEKDKIHPEDGRHYGVIAQEIEKVLPEIVKEDNEGNKAVAYMEIIPVLIEAMKEQQKQIMEQQKEIEQLKNTVAKSR